MIARHKVPTQVGADSLNKSDFDLYFPHWLTSVCVAQMQTVSDRDVHDQEVETLGRKLTEAEREAAAANVCFSP